MKNENSLEEQITKIERIVSELESDDIELEKAVDQYGAAIKLTSEALSNFETIKSKLTVLQRDGDQLFENDHDVI